MSVLIFMIIPSVTALRVLLDENPTDPDMAKDLEAFTEWRFPKDSTRSLFVKQNDKQNEGQNENEWGLEYFNPPRITTPELSLIKSCSETTITRVGAPGSPPPTGSFFDDKDVENFFDFVDHAYIVCATCTRTLPGALQHKSSMLHVIKGDECLGLQDENGKYGHFTRVSASHRMIIADALSKKYNSILIIEEDAQISLNKHQTDLRALKNLMTHDHTWDLVRLGWGAYEKNKWSGYDTHASNATMGSKMGNCESRCHCKIKSKEACTLDSGNCELLSSVGYILSKRAYSTWLMNGKDEVIDWFINRFNTLLMTPPLLSQGGPAKSYQTTKASGEFLKECGQK